MSRPPEFLRRIFVRPVRYFGRIEERWVRARPGSVLILVVALLVLMAMMGTAFISTSRSDRFSSQQNSFNTEVDLLINAVCKIEQTRILNATGSPLTTPSGTNDSMIWTSTADSNWFGSRIPVMLSNGSPGWAQVASAPAGTTFESPYNATAGTAPLTYSTYQNLAPTSLTVTTSSGSASYPALTDIATGNTYLAASASGSGIADAPLWRLPIGQVNGVTYFAGIFVTDNSSAVNASIAYQPNTSATMPGNFFPSNIDLAGMLNASTISASQQLTALNTYRFNGNAASLVAIYDSGVMASYPFISAYDAMWSQLGRRLDNAGYNTATARYQALPMGESATMGHRYCLTNPAASPSILENALGPSVMFSSNGVSIPGTPYGPSQAATWFNNNFVYDNQAATGFNNNFVNGSGGGNLRPLLVARNQVSNLSASCFTPQNAWNGATAYNFGDWVIGADGCSYVCVEENTNQSPTPSTDPTTYKYWAQEPWTDYPVKTSINTASFGQLWPAYWSVMSAQSPGYPDTASSTTIFRNPLRSAVNVSGNNGNNNNNSSATTVTLSPQGGDNAGYILAMAQSAPAGATIAFSPGTYYVGSTINLPGNHLYTGGGSPANGIATLTPTEVLRLRAGLASINTEQLRSASSDVVSRLVFMGGAIQPGPAPGQTGGAVITGTAHKVTFNFASVSNVEVTGFTFDTGNLEFGNCSVNFHGNTLQNQTDNAIYATGISNTQINNNTFSNVTSGGIMAYPGDNNAFDNNTFIHVFEPIHIFDGNNSTAPGEHSDHDDVSGNTITYASRNAIELQSTLTNLTVEGNYVSQWDPTGNVQSDGNSAHMALSCATGGSPSPPYDRQGNNIDIGNNVFLLNGVPGQTAATSVYALTAIEIMGENVKIHDNFCGGCGLGIMNGAYLTPVMCTNNTWVAYQVAGNDGVPWPVAPITEIGDKFYNWNDGSAPSPPASAGSSTPPTSTPPPPAGSATGSLQYRVMLYGASVQPYITEVYANNDQSTGTGYMAIALYNPYNTTISLQNWQWITVTRTKGESQLVLNSLSGGPTDLSTVLSAGIGPYQRVVFQSGNPPPNIKFDGAVATTVTIPQLTQALNLELMLMRPRQTNGQFSSSQDPNDTYAESATNLYDLVPVDSYDFTGLPASPSSDDQDSAEWHYIRPSDAAHNWWFVYPYTYNMDPTQNPTPAPAPLNQLEPIPMPRLFATQVTYGSTPTTVSFGAADGAPANSYYNGKGFPIQMNNTDFGGPKGQPASQFPFGEFARNGDVLQTTYVGAYRIDYLTTNPQTGAMTAQVVEMQPVTMDSAFADDMDDSDNQAENVGRFCPLNPADCNGKYNDFSNSGPASAYHFTTRLFDFVSVNAPSDDYMPNVGAENALSSARLGIANVKPSIINAYSNGSLYTEDNVPIDGLININTAPWRVLAALPMVDGAVYSPTPNAAAQANIKLAQAIVLYRDGDGTANNPAHGPFHSIFDLNVVPGFRTTFGTYANGNFSVSGLDQGITDSDLAPFVTGSNDGVYGDFKKQFLAFNRISNLVTVRSDSFTTYVIVQGWRNAGTAAPELVVQRRAAFTADRSGVTPTNKTLNITNMPVN